MYKVRLLSPCFFSDYKGEQKYFNEDSEVNMIGVRLNKSGYCEAIITYEGYIAYISILSVELVNCDVAYFEEE